MNIFNDLHQIKSSLSSRKKNRGNKSKMPTITVTSKALTYKQDISSFLFHSWALNTILSQNTMEQTDWSCEFSKLDDSQTFQV